ncbi:MAG TPA: lipocalin family protein [Burkholderiales bacterium]|nr:lipocalin family protein [Burkholderiales bacterium]
MSIRTVSAAVALTACLAGPASAQAPAPARGEYFTRWEGRWYEVARMANGPQRKCGPEVAATFLRRTDGNISVIHQCRTTDGVWGVSIGEGRFEEAPTPGTLGVRFTPHWYTVPPFSFGDYYALTLDLNARYVLLGSTDRDHLWIMSQTRTLDEPAYQRAVAQATALGYDTAKLIRTVK